MADAFNVSNDNSGSIDSVDRLWKQALDLDQSIGHSSNEDLE